MKLLSDVALDRREKLRAEVTFVGGYLVEFQSR